MEGGSEAVPCTGGSDPAPCLRAKTHQKVLSNQSYTFRKMPAMVEDDGTDAAVSFGGRRRNRKGGEEEDGLGCSRIRFATLGQAAAQSSRNS